jgi:thiamine pyrophosphate-dependent acetolactate synthase large subunit-like protein
VKWAARITDLRIAPQLIEQAVRISMVGRPGCTYIEVPGDVLRQSVDEKLLRFPPSFECNVDQLSRLVSSIPRSLAPHN